MYMYMHICQHVYLQLTLHIHILISTPFLDTYMYTYSHCVSHKSRVPQSEVGHLTTPRLPRPFPRLRKLSISCGTIPLKFHSLPTTARSTLSLNWTYMTCGQSGRVMRRSVLGSYTHTLRTSDTHSTNMTQEDMCFVCHIYISLSCVVSYVWFDPASWAASVHVHVAQLVEHLPRMQNVTGFSSTWGTHFWKWLPWVSCICIVLHCFEI